MFRLAVVSLTGLLSLAACGGDEGNSFPPRPAPTPQPPTSLWTSLGEIPAHASSRADHTPLVVSGGEVFVGTREGVWWRPIVGTENWTRTGEAVFTVFALRADPQNENTLFAGGAPAVFNRPTFYRSDDRGRHSRA